MNLIKVKELVEAGKKDELVTYLKETGFPEDTAITTAETMLEQYKMQNEHKEEIMEQNKLSTKDSVAVIAAMTGNVIGNLVNGGVSLLKAAKDRLPTPEQIGKGIGHTVEFGHATTKAGLKVGKSVLDTTVKIAVDSAKASKKTGQSFMSEFTKGYKEVRK